MHEKKYDLGLSNSMMTFVKKFRLSIVFIIVSFVAFLIQLLFGFDIVSTTLNYGSKTENMCCLTLVPFLFIGMIFDCIRHVSTKKDYEKKLLYRQAIFELNHLVRNLQSKFIIINNSDSTRDEFGKEIVSLLNQSSKDIEEILDKLSLLDDATPESIKKICRSGED